MITAPAPRLLLVTADDAFAERVDREWLGGWSDATLRRHDPDLDGTLAEGFVAAGYDVVLLDAAGDGHRASSWLADFAARAEFPPVVLFAPDGVAADVPNETLDVRVIPRELTRGSALIDVVAGATRARRRARALLRSRADASARYRFGPVTIRGHRPMRLIAQGGTSTVYLAESERTGDIVALKVLDRVPDATGDLRDFDRFIDEYQILAEQSHRSIVRIFDLGIADDHLFIAMEHFPLGSLRTLMQGPLLAGKALAIAAEIARALDVVHAVGILHRDLKPGNVMLRQDGSLALIDFGLADAPQVTSAGPGRILGTPEYMSPEQGHGDAVDARSDLYSLGVVLYELLAGRRPYDAETPFAVLYQHRNAPVPTLPVGLTELNPLIACLLAKRPEDRFPDAAAALAELERCLEQYPADA